MNAQEIKSVRELLNLNQVQLAQLLGVHPITVSKWERNEALPTAYQSALLNHFRDGARDNEVRTSVESLLIGMGVGVALAFLLKHLTKK
jgi:transcriptional regulator with XRE-family HTH domain